MGLLEYLWIVLIGLAAGWIAGKLTRGRSLGPLRNIIVGIVGALIGSFVFQLLGIYAGGLLGRLLMAVVGAILFLYLVRLIR